ncbi:MAG: Kae1-associated serine/threonine protein kinase [Candidatus Aenigmarchaeota archaeon]|nr:Kae1-associated serine/threonine protein kinase [Candidatus Aenigmarchaeota archaeon]
MLLKIGAEAVVKTVPFDGKKAVLKERVRKNYRVEELDKKLRSQRTRTEARITGDARRAGIKAAQIYFTDEKNCSIYFELIDGVGLKDAFDSANDRRISELAEKWGSETAKLHEAGIIHGDLTTSNLVVRGDGLYFLDFGLAFFSERDEDAAEDINLLRQSVEATHSERSAKIWENFIKGYAANPKSARIIGIAASIASRGRYSKRKKA